jgi:hypothetical protein
MMTFSSALAGVQLHVHEMRSNLIKAVDPLE